jgi:riboflavin biosynthesis pyrimidine reductase
VLCEGGPRLHANLLERGLIDELFVTSAPKLAGGGGPTLLEGAPPVQHALEPVWLCEQGGEVFARYRVRS